MYKGIIFDLDNTLLNYSLSEIDSMKHALSTHQVFENLEEEWEAFWQSYIPRNFEYWIDFVNKRGPSTSIEDVLIRSFRDTLDVDSTMHEKLSYTYWERFSNTCIFEVGAERLLQELAPEYTLGIISNGIGEAQRKRLAAGNIDHLFHSIVVSDEVDVRKPRKEIFEIALQELGLKKHEVIFIGDSLSDDYHGALNAGIDFCYYNGRNIEIPRGIEPQYTLSELSDIQKILRKG